MASTISRPYIVTASLYVMMLITILSSPHGISLARTRSKPQGVWMRSDPKGLGSGLGARHLPAASGRRACSGRLSLITQQGASLAFGHALQSFNARHPSPADPEPFELLGLDELEDRCAVDGPPGASR